MNPPNLTDKRCPWCGENHPPEMIRLWGDLATTCPRLAANEAVMLAPSHRVTPAEIEALGQMVGALKSPSSNCWRQEYMCELPEQPTPEPVAMARAADGSPVVAFQPHGLEVRAFGVDDLDERGLPRWKP